MIDVLVHFRLISGLVRSGPGLMRATFHVEVSGFTLYCGL